MAQKIITIEPKLWFESYYHRLDWNPDLKGQGVSNVVVFVVDNEGNAANSVATHVSMVDGIQTIRLTGGYAGRQYTITSRITLTDGSIFEQDLLLPVVDRVTPIKIIQKQSAEKIDLGLFYDRDLEGDGILSTVLWAVGSDGSTKDIIDDRGFDSAKGLVSLRVRDGVPGEDYVVNIKINTTPTAHVLGDQILVRIQE